MAGEMGGHSKQRMDRQGRQAGRAHPDNEAKRGIEVYRDDLVCDGWRQATSMQLPAAIHHRLDELVRLARGVAASRAEIVAMLIGSAALDEGELEKQVIAFRKLTVGEALPGMFPPAVDGGEDKVVIPLHGPGRRRQQRAAES